MTLRVNLSCENFHPWDPRFLVLALRPVRNQQFAGLNAPLCKLLRKRPTAIIAGLECLLSRRINSLPMSRNISRAVSALPALGSMPCQRSFSRLVILITGSTSVRIILYCHSERSEESRINFGPMSIRLIQRCFASLNMTELTMREV